MTWRTMWRAKLIWPHFGAAEPPPPCVAWQEGLCEQALDRDRSMTHLDCEYSHRDADSVRRFNVGRVLVLKNPPAMGFIICIIMSGAAFFFPSVRQGLTLVHISAQRKHFLWDTVGGFSDTNGSG